MIDKDDIFNKLKSNKERLKCFTLKKKNHGKDDISNHIKSIKKNNSITVYCLQFDKNPIQLFNIKCYKNLNSNYNYLIILPIYNYKGYISYNMYYWIGNQYNIKNNFNICYFTTILSYELNVNKMFREVSGFESDEFKILFTDYSSKI